MDGLFNLCKIGAKYSIGMRKGNMSKLVFWIVLIGVGVAIGINYQDEILDMLNMRDMENLYDHIEDAADSVQNGSDSLSDTVSQLAE